MKIYAIGEHRLPAYVAEGSHEHEQKIKHISLGIYAISSIVVTYLLGMSLMALGVIAAIACFDVLSGQLVGSKLIYFTTKWSRQTYREEYVSALESLNSLELEAVIGEASKRNDLGTQLLAELVLGDKKEGP